MYGAPTFTWPLHGPPAQTNNQLVGCGFDAAGNQTNDCLGHTIVYDAENRVVTAGGVTYTYDGDAQRVKKSSGKLYWGALTESDLSGNATADFVFFASQRIARVDLPSGTVHYFFTDHLTSIGVVTNATGTTIEQEIDHRPFGEESIVANTISDQNYRFMGKEHDPETAYDFFGARYYNSMSGRWLSPDWTSSPSAVPYATLVNPQTLNLYAFVENNPATNVELDGHIFEYNRHLEAHYVWVSEEPPDSLESTGLISVGTPEAPEPVPQPEPASTSSATSGAGSQSTAAANEHVDYPTAGQIAQNRTPAKGDPNTKSTHTNEDGSTTERHFGPDGKAQKDIDSGHDHGAGDPHAHDWDWNKEKDPRGPGRPIKPHEHPKPPPPPPLGVPFRIPGPFPIIINPCLFPTLRYYLPNYCAPTQPTSA